LRSRKNVTDAKVSERYVEHQSSTLLGDTKSAQSGDEDENGEEVMRERRQEVFDGIKIVSRNFFLHVHDSTLRPRVVLIVEVPTVLFPTFPHRFILVSYLFPPFHSSFLLLLRFPLG
jgi:hypothetical protein